MNRARRALLTAITVLALLWVLALLFTLQNFTVAGSAQHSNAWAAALKECPQDEGEAVADAEADGDPVPTRDAQERCAREGRRRLQPLGLVTLLLVAAGVGLSVLHAARVTTDEPAPSEGTG